MPMSDMKWCDLWDDWRKIAQDRGAWRSMVMKAAVISNEHKEAHEKEKTDGRKKRKEEGTQPAVWDLKCEESGCDFVGQTKADLVNHVRQRHGNLGMVVLQCRFCGQPF